ncbi:hypothetical protein Hanom_Chr14g01283981 [Helianthus anomalus]
MYVSNVRVSYTNITKNELQILSFIYIPNFRRCPLSLKLTSFYLLFQKSCTVCPFALIKLIFSVKSDYVPCT